MFSMANEAVIIELTGQPKGRPRTYTVAPPFACEKGTLLFLEDARTVSGAFVTGGKNPKAFAGIASTECVSGETTIGAWTEGTFDLTHATQAGKVAKAGEMVVSSGANLICPMFRNTVSGQAVELISGCLIGKALETASSAEVINVAINV